MPRATATKQYRDFTGGLITDSSKLNMPENTVTDIENFNLDKSGKISRVQYDLETQTRTLDITQAQLASTKYLVDTFVWDSPAGNEDKSLVVVRAGQYLYFYDLEVLDPNAELGDNYINSLLISSAEITTDMRTEPMQFANGKGVLFVSNRFMKPGYITWDGSTTFTLNSGEIAIRDFDGVDDGLGFSEDVAYSGDIFMWLDSVVGNFSVAETVTEGANTGTVVSWDATNGILRVTTSNIWTLGNTVTGGTSGATGSLTVRTPVMGDYISSSKNNKLYNLINAGWDPAQITKYTVEQGFEPDRTKIWYLGKDTNNNFDPDELDKIYFGFSEVSQGRIVLQVPTRDREDSITYAGKNVFTVGGTAIVDTTTDGNERPTTCEFGFGRAWFSGCKAEASSNKVWFSQIILEDLKRHNDCYQRQDPTAEDFNSLLDTDGGEIRLTDAGDIKKLISFRNHMLVFASNGVWAISSPEAGFRPNSFGVSKITNEGVLSPESVVETPDSVYYWGQSGIFQLVPAPEGLTLGVRNISDNRINDYYQGKTSLGGNNAAIKSGGRNYCKGVYDTTENRVVWIFNKQQTEPQTSNFSARNYQLIYDINLDSFNRGLLFDGGDPFVATLGVVSKPGFGLKYLTTDTNISSGSNIIVQWYDLIGSSGFIEDSYLETFYETLGDTSREKNTLWVITHFERTEDGYENNGSGGVILSNQSSCMFRSKWDWTDTASANRWSSSNQIYRLRRIFIPTSASTPFDYGFTVITTKNKVRGHGKSVQFRFDSEDSKDMRILGWDVVYEGNGTV